MPREARQEQRYPCGPTTLKAAALGPTAHRESKAERPARRRTGGERMGAEEVEAATSNPVMYCLEQF